MIYQNLILSGADYDRTGRGDLMAIALQISRREKLFISIAGVFLSLFVIFQLMVFPLMDKRIQLKRKITVKEKTIAEMLTLKSEYDAVRTKAEFAKKRIAARDKSFTLFSFLDRLAGEVGLKDNINYMKPSTSESKNSPFKISLVEMKLQAVTMKDLTGYLYKIETSKNIIIIRRLSLIKTGKQEKLIDAVLQLETIET